MHRFADTKKVAEIIMNLDKSIIETQRIALEARALGLACSTYISLLPGADSVVLGQLDQLIDDSSDSLEPVERHVREAAKSAVRTIFRQSVLNRQESRSERPQAMKLSIKS